MDSLDVKVLQEKADIDGPLVDYKQKGNKVELVGKEKAEGRDAYNLKITLKNGEVQNFYLDAVTFLLIKSSGMATVRGIAVKFEKIFSDYKNVQGVMFPFSVELRTETVPGGAQGSETTTFRRVEINVPVDDLIFSMPPATR